MISVNVKNPDLKESKAKGPYLRFDVELRNAQGELGLTVSGCRVMGGNLMGPFVIPPGGRPIPQAKFYGLAPDVLKAITDAGWKRDFPSIKFPEAAPQ